MFRRLLQQFFCSLPDMETHADLIAGLCLHLHEIFDDIRTSFPPRLREIQLESLKLLPGTEMREELKNWVFNIPPSPLRSLANRIRPE